MLSKAVRVQNKNLVKAAVVSFHLFLLTFCLYTRNDLIRFHPSSRIDRKRILGFNPQHPNHFP